MSAHRTRKKEEPRTDKDDDHLLMRKQQIVFFLTAPRSQQTERSYSQDVQTGTLASCGQQDQTAQHILDRHTLQQALRR